MAFGIGTWIKRQWAKALGLLRPLFTIVAEGVQSELLDVVNDPVLQAVALSACRDAWHAGLSGDDAWRHAFDKLADELTVRGKSIALNMAELLLKAVYSVWKAGGYK